jgi:hypothetical protein
MSGIDEVIGFETCGSRAAGLRRSEQTRFSSVSDDEVGGISARSTVSGASKYVC